MREIVFLLEELSAKVLLEGLFHRLVPDSGIIPRFLVFEGKQDLEKSLPKRISGYLNPNARFIVMRDQDQGDCHQIKASLVGLCPESKRSRTTIRIACRELEAFYLGDLMVVESGLQIEGLAARQEQAKFRDPDRLHSPSRELETLTHKLYHNVSGSRAIAPYLNTESPRSRSLYHLIQAIRSAAQ